MAGADRNRVQQYLSATREPESSGLDTGLFIRGLVDPGTPEDDVRADYEQRRAAGKDDNTIGQEYVGLGQRELAKSWTQQRSEAMKRYTDQNERSRAIADAETGVQKVARILGEMANAYAGGKPGEITATLRKYRDAERARADKLAGDTFAFEVGGIDAEREDARAAATLEASRNERETARTFTAGENEKNRTNTLAAAGAQREFTAGENEKNRANTLKAAGVRADAAAAAAAAKPPTEDQAKAATFATLMEEGMRSIDASGYNANASGVRIERELPPEAQSPEYQKYRNGVRLFAAAWLRRISGAAVTPTEVNDVDDQFFPQPGEDAELVEQKRRAREVVIKALKHSAGRAMPAPEAGGSSTPPPNAGGSGEVQTRMVGGQEVRVRKRADGKWEEVQ